MKSIKIFLVMVLGMAASTASAQDFSDNFQVRRMDAKHFHLMDQDESIVNMGTRGMTIMAKGETPKDANVVYFDATDKAWEAEANLTLYPTSEGGLVLMNDRNEYWGVTATYSKIYVRDGEKVVKTVANSYGRYIRVRLSYKDGKLTVAVAPSAGTQVVANDNPSGSRTPAKSCKVLETMDVKNASRIALTSAKKDVVSVRDFWYTKK